MERFHQNTALKARAPRTSLSAPVNQRQQPSGPARQAPLRRPHEDAGAKLSQPSSSKATHVSCNRRNRRQPVLIEALVQESPSRRPPVQPALEPRSSSPALCSCRDRLLHCCYLETGRRLLLTLQPYLDTSPAPPPPRPTRGTHWCSQAVRITAWVGFLQKGCNSPLVPAQCGFEQRGFFNWGGSIAARPTSLGLEPMEGTRKVPSSGTYKLCRDDLSRREFQKPSAVC